MNTDWHELIQRYLADLTTAEETDTLQAALKTDANLRALFLDYMNLDVALGALAEAAERTAVDPLPTPQPRWTTWRPLATAAACAALLLCGALLFSRKSSTARPDLAAAFASTEDAIAHLPEPPLAPLPEWVSPTAAMLDPAGLRPFTF